MVIFHWIFYHQKWWFPKSWVYPKISDKGVPPIRPCPQRCWQAIYIDICNAVVDVETRCILNYTLNIIFVIYIYIHLYYNMCIYIYVYIHAHTYCVWRTIYVTIAARWWKSPTATARSPLVFSLDVVVFHGRDIGEKMRKTLGKSPHMNGKIMETYENITEKLMKSSGCFNGCKNYNFHPASPVNGCLSAMATQKHGFSGAVWSEELSYWSYQMYL